MSGVASYIKQLRNKTYRNVFVHGVGNKLFFLLGFLQSRMLQDVADRHEPTGKVETEAEAHERLACKGKHNRLAKNRLAARRTRYLAYVRKCPQHGFEPAEDLLASIHAGRGKANICGHYGIG